METKIIHRVFDNYEDYKTNKFNLLIDYSAKTKILTSEKVNDWFSKNKIENKLDLKNNYDNFLKYVVNLYTDSYNCSNLAIHLVKKKSLSLQDIIKNKNQTQYLFDVWLKSLNRVELLYSRNSDENKKKHIKTILKKKNLQFSFFKKLKPESFEKPKSNGFKIYIVIDDCDLIHIVDNSKYNYNTKKYGCEITSIIEKDFKKSMLFLYLKDKKIEFLF